MTTLDGHRLRVVRTLTTAAAFYGSDTYGTKTYGTRASDPADLQAYVAVPTTTGLAGPVTLRDVVRNAGQLMSFLIVAFGGPFEETPGTPLDLSTVNTATMRLDRTSEGLPTTFNLPLTVNEPDRTIERYLEPNDLPAPGTYRVLIVLEFTSGRRMTITTQDQMSMRVADGTPSVTVFTPPPPELERAL